MSVTASRAAVSIRFHIDTGGRPLTESELPIASGSTAPGLAGTAPIQASLRDPAQVVQFIESVLRETQPGVYAKFLRQQAQLTHRSGFSFDALVNMLTGDLNVASDTHATIARAQLSNPAAARAMLAKLARATGTVHGTSELRATGGGLYSLATSRQRLTVGIIGDQLLIGKASGAQLRSFAAAPATTASGTGAVTFRISLPQLLQTALRHPPTPAEAQAFSLLGDLTGSASATTSGLTGTATIARR
jgi:hypothetical protein